MRRPFVLGIALLCALLWSRTASAGGFDTPMLYSAEHMGMGGVAVSFVDDPSALFHNPAGLARAPRLSVLADFSGLSDEDSMTFGKRLTREAGVAPVPGGSFFSVPERGHSLARFVFCKRLDTLREAGDRLRAFAARG